MYVVTYEKWTENSNFKWKQKSWIWLTGLNTFENVINAERIEIDVGERGGGTGRSSKLFNKAGEQQKLQKLPAIAPILLHQGSALHRISHKKEKEL